MFIVLPKIIALNSFSDMRSNRTEDMYIKPETIGVISPWRNSSNDPNDRTLTLVYIHGTNLNFQINLRPAEVLHIVEAASPKGYLRPNRQQGA